MNPCVGAPTLHSRREHHPCVGAAQLPLSRLPKRTSSQASVPRMNPCVGAPTTPGESTIPTWAQHRMSAPSGASTLAQAPQGNIVPSFSPTHVSLRGRSDLPLQEKAPSQRGRRTGHHECPLGVATQAAPGPLYAGPPGPPWGAPRRARARDSLLATFTPRVALLRELGNNKLIPLPNSPAFGRKSQCPAYCL